MKYDVRICEILKKEEIAKGIYDLTVEAGELAEKAQPGQFAQIYIPGKTLRRPISICSADAAQRTMRFVFEIRGDGTKLLSEIQEGQSLDILAPLGQGFCLGDTSRRALFVGGGIGTPPLLYAARKFGGNASVALGFRNAEAVILEKDFRDAGCKVQIATDDGSYGYHGLVIDCIGQEMPEVVFACGPGPMLRAVSKFAADRGIPCQISLEERMACGIGACLGCACKILRDGREVYGHVCKDGPVFDAQEIVWEVG